MYWYNFWLRRWQWYFIIFTCGSCLDSILFMVIKEWIKWIAIVNLWMFCSSKILVIIFYDWTTYLFAIFHPFSRNRCSFVVIVFTIYTNATFQSGFFLLQYKFSVIWIQKFLAWIKYSMILFLLQGTYFPNYWTHSVLTIFNWNLFIDTRCLTEDIFVSLGSSPIHTIRIIWCFLITNFWWSTALEINFWAHRRCIIPMNIIIIT